MADLSGFDANEHEPQGFEPIPAGQYPAIIIASDLKTTKSGTGKYLKLELQLLSGKYQNRKLWDNLNIVNPNETAVQIAKGTLSAICRAVGVMTPKDSSELHNKPLIVIVKMGKDQNGNPQNVVSGYKKREDAKSETFANAEQAEAVTESSPW